MPERPGLVGRCPISRSFLCIMKGKGPEKRLSGRNGGVACGFVFLQQREPYYRQPDKERTNCYRLSGFFACSSGKPLFPGGSKSVSAGTDYYLFMASSSSMILRSLLKRGILCCPPSFPFARNQSWNNAGLALTISSRESAIPLYRLAS